MEIIQIIQKYIQIMKEILERVRLQEEIVRLEYIRNTKIVAHYFFLMGMVNFLVVIVKIRFYLKTLENL